MGLGQVSKILERLLNAHFRKNIFESLNLDPVFNCVEVPQEILGISLTGVACKLSSEEISDTMRYFLKGLESGMVVVRFAEGVFGVSISPKLMNFCT